MMACAPAVNEPERIDPVPALSATLPIGALPSNSVTFPLGVPAAGAIGWTFTVSVTNCPYQGGLLSIATVVAVCHCSTVCVNGADAMGKNAPAKEYVATMSCVPTARLMIVSCAV